MLTTYTKSREHARRRRSIRKPIPKPIIASEREQCWAVLQDAFKAIHSKRASRLSFEKLYRQAYKLVLQKEGLWLYEGVLEWHKDWLKVVTLREIRSARVDHTPRKPLNFPTQDVTQGQKIFASKRFLMAFKRVWDTYFLSIDMVSDVLMYLDRCRETELIPVHQACMRYFGEIVLNSTLQEPGSETVLEALNLTILDLIRANRLGNTIDNNLIRACIFSLENTHMAIDASSKGDDFFTTRLEPLFLDTTRKFYDDKVSSLADRTTIVDFCRCVRKWLSREELICHSLMPRVMEEKTKNLVIEALERPYLEHMSELDGPDMKGILQDGNLWDLGVIYDIIQRVDDDKKPLKILLRNWILESGAEPIGCIEEDSITALDNRTQDTGEMGFKWIWKIIQLKHRLDEVLRKGLRSDSCLKVTMSSAFSEMIQECAKSSEYLSNFFDHLLRGISTEPGSMRDDSRFSEGLSLIPLIPDKHVFQHSYLSHLSTRLSTHDANVTVEEELLSSMESQMEAGFTEQARALFRRHTGKLLCDGGSQHDASGLGGLKGTTKLVSLPAIESVIA